MRRGVLVGVLTGAALPAFAQGTKADYARAATLGQRVIGKFTSGAIRPHWIINSGKGASADGTNAPGENADGTNAPGENADGTNAPGENAGGTNVNGSGRRFWYRRDLPDGKRAFLLVDPAKASRQPAFDASRMAASLSKALGRNLDAERLPIDDLVFDAVFPTVSVQVNGRTFYCDLNTYDLRPAPPPTSGLSLADAPRASRSGGEETVLTFQNRTAGDLTLYWLNTEGQRVAYGGLRAGAAREIHTYAGHVWIALDGGGRPLGAWVARATPESAEIYPILPPLPPPRRRAAAAADVSPDGRWRVFVRDNNVVLQDAQSKSDTPVTTSGTPADAYEGQPTWSPDSLHFVLLRTVAAQEHKVYLVESSPKDQEQPKIHSNDYLKPGDRIAHPRPHLFTLAIQPAAQNNAAKPDIPTVTDVPIKDDLFSTPWAIEDIHWEPDSRRFTFLYNQRGHQVMRLIAVDAHTGATQPVIDEQANTFIDYTNKVFLHRLDNTHEAVWMSERDGWNHLYLYDTAAGQVKNQITKGNWVVRGVDRVDEARRQIWFHVGGIYPGQDPYYIHYARINFDGSGLTLLTDGDGTHTLAYSPDGRYYVDTYSRVDLPPVSELRRADTGAKVLDLEKGDAHGLLATGWTYPQRFTAKGRDGATDIYGVIVRPSSFDPTRKYPVLENIYAGPQGAFVPKAFSPANGMQAMADLGFIVVQMDGMGTNWRSRAFHDVCWHDLGDAGFPDRIAWIKAAAAIRPYMDLTRVGIYGTSAGGQNALGGLLRHGDFYKAGVADCGCHDNRMDKIWWNEQWMGWPLGPWYASSSNVTLAPRLTGKLLLMVGEMDTNVDPASTMQVVDALIKADKDFELLVMPGQGHGVAGSPYGKRRLEDFFVRTLLGVTPRVQ